MKSVERAHIVVVADSDHGLVLADRIRRMAVMRVTAVAGLDEAKAMCLSGGTDACIVAIDDLAPDAMPVADTDAPGRMCGVPSLMIVPVLTPYLCKRARRCGYVAALAASIAPRLLYRRIGGALQQRRTSRHSRRRLPGGIVRPVSLPLTPGFGKATLH
ncbi:MAG: hypothetical protein Q8M24_21880 [Pseudolabrys sp.]|nr:hypothetical protein [Pseudolabrys sp.]